MALKLESRSFIEIASLETKDPPVPTCKRCCHVDYGNFLSTVSSITFPKLVLFLLLGPGLFVTTVSSLVTVPRLTAARLFAAAPLDDSGCFQISGSFIRSRWATNCQLRPRYCVNSCCSQQCRALIMKDTYGGSKYRSLLPLRVSDYSLDVDIGAYNSSNFTNEGVLTKATKSKQARSSSSSSSAGCINSIHLIHFPKLYVTTSGDEGSDETKWGVYKTSKAMRYLERWKRYCLGDGGVYFDQRPKTLAALNRLLCDRLIAVFASSFTNDDGANNEKLFDVGATNTKTYNTTKEGSKADIDVECAILSTCARLEIMISIELRSISLHTLLTKHEIEMLVESTTARFLSEQVVSYRRGKRMSFFLNKFIPFSLYDRPSRIRHESETRFFRSMFQSSSQQQRRQQHYQAQVSNFTHDLLSETNHVTGVEHVARRICELAAGLRSNRDRSVDGSVSEATTFRPFSARDSHVVSQMKRSANGASRRVRSEDVEEVFETVVHEQSSSSSPDVRYTKLIFDSALRASKAARSPKIVPILHSLRVAIDDGPGPPPTALVVEAAASASKLAVEPIVNVCVGRWRVMEGGDKGVGKKIRDLREGARKIMIEGETFEGKWGERKLKRLLHSPTMELREGKSVVLEEVLVRIEKEMKADFDTEGIL